MTQDNNQEKTQEINELDNSVEQAAAEPTPEPAAPLTPEEKKCCSRGPNPRAPRSVFAR